MRLFRSLAPVTVAAAVVLCLPYDALPHARAALPAAEQPFGAECRTTVHGSEVVAWCHNPYVDTDRVALHIECARWWDLDTDSAPAEVGPATTVRLDGRCWKEVEAVWISHAKA